MKSPIYHLFVIGKTSSSLYGAAAGKDADKWLRQLRARFPNRRFMKAEIKKIGEADNSVINARIVFLASQTSKHPRD